MSARELAEWMAHDAMSPLPDRRMDHHFAALTANLMSAQTKRKDGRAWQHKDFLLFQPPEPAPDEAERRARVARELLAAFRGLRAKA
jgi:hypothetical protein